MSEVRYCKKCDTHKAPELFGNYAKGPGGLSYYCRSCVQADSKARYRADPERYKEYARQWAEANPEKRREIGLKGSRTYYARNPEARAAACRRWDKANPLKRAAYDAKKKASRKARVVCWDAELDQLVLDEATHLKQLREQFTGFEWHVDHIVPLQAKTVSGLHNAFNLAVVPALFNVRKKNRVVDQSGFVTTGSA